MYLFHAEHNNSTHKSNFIWQEHYQLIDVKYAWQLNMINTISDITLCVVVKEIMQCNYISTDLPSYILMAMSLRCLNV